MSLIVGRVIKEQIFLLGETELTDPNGEQLHPVLNGCLKVLRLSDSVAIGFAGSTHRFAALFPSFVNAPFPSAIVELACAAQTDHADFDLIVAEVGNPNLAIVKHGKVNFSPLGFIGNDDAFNEYQRARNTPEELDDPWLIGRSGVSFIKMPEPVMEGNEGEEFPAALSAFERVVRERRIKGVGGVTVPLCTHNGRFTFMSYIRSVSAVLEFSVFNEWVPVPFGSDEQGGCAMEFIGSKSIDEHVCGFFFLQGKFGVIFPESDDGICRAHVVSNVDPAEFTLETKRILGTELVSSFMEDAHLLRAAEKAIRAGRNEDAVSLYELRDWKAVFPLEIGMRERFVDGLATALYNTRNPKGAFCIMEEWLKANDTPRIRKVMADIQRLEAIRLGVNFQVGSFYYR